MKKRLAILCLSIAILFLTACGNNYTSQIEQESQDPIISSEVDHTEEWGAQADEVRPFIKETLSAVLPSKYGGEARVTNQHGSIVIRINTFNRYLTFRHYAEVVRSCCDKYFELIDEYSEYSFSPISIYYIAEDASLILKYTVDSSGMGEFEENRIESFTIPLTPDEVYNRLQDTLNYV